ncbi:GAP1-N2 domain-containing protein [Rhodococcus erythropolis]|uniref:GAP1-N2 domain-containing protein n=1 Tax=Rhodococcus erythropolis TaxID=1833 RepID=UPI0037FCDFB6
MTTGGFSETDFTTGVLAGDQRAVPRCGQLTYTSFDRPTAGRGQVLGGWQVKAVAGGLDEFEQDAVRVGINTRFETVVALPTFPTQEEIEGRPRRLHYGPLIGDSVAYWHSVQAGSDASGRPGNVFVHVLVDRAPLLPPLRRPISLWRSSGWLTPFGAELVARSELVETEPFPEGEVLELSRIVNFVLDPGVWRIGVLSVLLDAVQDAIAKRGTVILGVEDPERGALWVGAVSALMASSAAARFYFSTYERHPSREDLEALNVHLVCVPIEDLAELELPGSVVVLSELETPSLGELDSSEGANHESHRTERDAEVEVTEWSVLAQTVFLDPDTAVEALTQLDDIAEAGPVFIAETAWPLAELVIRNDIFSDAQSEARRVIDRVQSPVRRIGSEQPVALSIAQSGTEYHGSRQDPFDSSSGDVPSVMPSGAIQQSQRVSEGYLGILAMPSLTPEQSEARWFRFLGIVRETPGWSTKGFDFRNIFGRLDARPTPELLRTVQSVAHGFLDRLNIEAMPVRSANSQSVEIEIVRFADLIMNAGLFDEGIEAPVRALIVRAVVPLLLDESTVQTFTASVGAISVPLRQLIRGCVVDERVNGSFTVRPLGFRVPRAAIVWMLPTEDVQIDGGIRGNATAVEEPTVALVADLVLRTVADSPRCHLGEWSPFVPLALWRVLWESRTKNDAEAAQAYFVGDATSLFSPEYLPHEDLLTLAQRFPDVVPPRYLQSTIISSRQPPEIGFVCANLVRDAEAGRLALTIGLRDVDGDATALSWAQVRLADRWAASGFAELERVVGLMRPALMSFCRMNAAEIAELSTDVLDRLVVLLFASRWARDRCAAPHVPFVGDAQISGLRHSILGSSDYARTNIAELIRSGIIDREWLLVTVMFLTDGAPGQARRRPDLLTSLGLGSENGAGLLESLARETLSDLRGFGDEVLSPIADMFREEVRRRPNVDSQAEIAKYRPFVWQWFEHLVMPTSESECSQGPLGRLGKDKI